MFFAGGRRGIRDRQDVRAGGVGARWSRLTCCESRGSLVLRARAFILHSGLDMRWRRAVREREGVRDGNWTTLVMLCGAGCRGIPGGTLGGLSVSQSRETWKEMWFVQHHLLQLNSRLARQSPTLSLRVWSRRWCKNVRQLWFRVELGFPTPGRTWLSRCGLVVCVLCRCWMYVLLRSVSVPERHGQGRWQREARDPQHTGDRTR
jgi:hypothetical protein